MLHGSSVGVIGSRASGLFRHTAAVALCALAAHAVAYGTLTPQGGAHRYFGWYAPIVAGLSIIALATTLLALTTALVSGPTSRATSLVRWLLPPASRETPLVARLFGLASAAVVFLAVQESLERSFASGRLELVSFAPVTLAVLVGVLVLTAAGIAVVERLVSSLVQVALRESRERRFRPTATRLRPAHIVLPVRRPLAVHGGLRAPPLPS